MPVRKAFGVLAVRVGTSKFAASSSTGIRSPALYHPVLQSMRTIQHKKNPAQRIRTRGITAVSPRALRTRSAPTRTKTGRPNGQCGLDHRPNCRPPCAIDCWRHRPDSRAITLYGGSCSKSERIVCRRLATNRSALLTLTNPASRIVRSALGSALCSRVGIPAGGYLRQARVQHRRGGVDRASRLASAISKGVIQLTSMSSVTAKRTGRHPS